MPRFLSPWCGNVAVHRGRQTQNIKNNPMQSRTGRGRGTWRGSRQSFWTAASFPA